jgi:hypothetical protein
MPTFAVLLASSLWVLGGPSDLADTPPRSQEPDTLDVIERVNFLLLQRYRESTAFRFGRDRRGRDALGQPFERTCDGDRDDVCFADDPDAGRCPNFVQCHPNPGRLVEGLLRATADYPVSGYLAGQAVYLLSKLGRLAEALSVAERCAAERWWCEALRGYALHALADHVRADAAMRHALAEAPDSIRCAWNDATWVLGQWSQRGADTSVPEAWASTEEWDCARRSAVSDTVWWLADPLYSVAGNDRWVEHVVRSMSAGFLDEIRLVLPASRGPQRYRDHLWAERVRRGALDSYDTAMGLTWTSRAAASYHFVPDVSPGDLSTPAWRLESGLDDEGYSPGARFVELPHQIARFRAGDSLRVAASTRVRGTPIEGALDAVATFVLTDAPGSAPLEVAGDPRLPAAIFLGRAPLQDYIASLEVVTSKGVGWHRGVLPALAAAGPELSDLLLYDPVGPDEPVGLESAVAVMRGTTTLRAAEPVGVYWETYGAPSGAALRVELTVERASGGLVERLRRLVPGRAEDGRGRITWTEPARSGTRASSVAVDLRDLPEGGYILVLRVGWDGRERMERRRPFRLD